MNTSVIFSEKEIEDFYLNKSYEEISSFDSNHSFMEEVAAHKGVHDQEQLAVEQRMADAFKELVDKKMAPNFRTPKADEKMGDFINDYLHINQGGSKAAETASATSDQLIIGKQAIEMPAGVHLEKVGDNGIKINLSAGSSIEGSLAKGDHGTIIFKGYYQGQKISQNLQLLIEEIEILKEGKYVFDLNSLKAGIS